ncbi:hypothetical protein, partial [Bacteroides congonensis]|uniref:hypothetical protein n=1 Tax=Bacteroides congonensis TaxID=1871006 RepID=UPI002FD9BE73
RKKVLNLPIVFSNQPLSLGADDYITKSFNEEKVTKRRFKTVFGFRIHLFGTFVALSLEEKSLSLLPKTN